MSKVALIVSADEENAGYHFESPDGMSKANLLLIWMTLQYVEDWIKEQLSPDFHYEVPADGSDDPDGT
jgi:hypothetical protein